MKHPNLKRPAALLCALLLVVSLCPVQAAERTFTIDSPADFYDFAGQCVRDAWSQGLTVELTADLTLSHDFTPVPIFQGTFHGNGHTISGVNWSEQGSKVGLFRTLTASAVVEDLTVDGALYPGGSASSVGLIAGENAGTIKNCTATGSVNGSAQVGGIAGLNTGTIQRCTNKATLKSVNSTGGITGRNDGTLSDCVNTGAVNTDPAMDAPTDTGGIVGLNPGAVTRCKNKGAVGSPHLGYNTGGIAGRQSGTIANCANSGDILGRKDVGGIVGQFEPYITYTYGVSAADQLDSALSQLSTLMHTFVNQVGALSTSSLSDVQAINDAAGALIDRAQSAGEEGKADLTAAGDSLYQDALSLSGDLDGLLDTAEAFQTDGGSALTDLRDAAADLRTAVEAMLEVGGDSLTDSGDALLDTLDDISDAVADIQNAIDSIHRETKALESYLKSLMDALKGGGLPGEAPDLNLTAHLDHIRKAADRLADSVQDLSYRLDKALNGLSDEMEDRGEEASDALDRLSKSSGQLQDTTDALLTQSLDRFRAVNDAAGRIRETVHTYSQTLSDQSQAAMDDIDVHAQTIRDRVNAMTDRATGDTAALQATANGILDQLTAVGDALAALTTAPEFHVEDYDQPLTEGPGLVTGCTVTGTIQGDSNTGGVAGILSPELGEDPEEDFDLGIDSLTVDTTAILRAVVQSCAFDGTVTVKNSCGGGIAGRCEVGALLDCSADAKVETGGDNCGGIVGSTKTPVIRCAVIADLKGGSYVGGIAGWGHDLTDCRAMTQAEASGECVGAIAGQADGTLSGNRYLMEELAGVDGVDLAGQAEGLTWADFSRLDGIPADFLTFSATFMADGKVLSSIPFSYDGTLDLSQVPALPASAAGYSAWPTFPSTHLKRSFTVEVLTQEPADTLSWGGSQPLLLALGSFDPDDVLSARTASSPEALDGKPCSAAYDYTIKGMDPAETVTLRIRTDAPERSQAALLIDGSWVLQNCTVDGSYLVLTAPAEGSVAVFTAPPSILPILFSVLGGVAALALIVLYLRRRIRGAKVTASV